MSLIGHRLTANCDFYYMPIYEEIHSLVFISHTVLFEISWENVHEKIKPKVPQHQAMNQHCLIE